MDSSQKRDRDRKQRQRRQDKDARKKERAEQKILRRTSPELFIAAADGPSEPMPDGSPENPPAIRAADQPAVEPAPDKISPA